jgi:hypothetical protein
MKILTITIFILIIFNSTAILSSHSYSLDLFQQRLPTNSEKLSFNENKKISLTDKIRFKAEENGINGDKAIEIAFCESSLNPNAKNKVSSAKGLFMFIDKTWENYCSGNVLNEDDNLDCFVKLYPKFPSWWECN